MNISLTAMIQKPTDFDTPYLRRRNLIHVTNVRDPDIDNWTRRGFLEKRTKRFYSASDLLTCMCLHALSRAGLELKNVEGLKKHLAGNNDLLVYDGGTPEAVRFEDFVLPNSQWFTVISLKQIRNEFTRFTGLTPK